MLNALNPKGYTNIYIVCEFTDMRGGINTLSFIIEDRYTWPRTSEEVRAMSPEQFRWLMHGFPSIHQFKFLILNTARRYHIFIVQKVENFSAFFLDLLSALYTV